jgi:succinoglycan biosynthesis protein ExoA
LPKVSVIIPCYNEQATIALTLDSIYKQTYPRQELQVIIADGLSTDQTRFEIDRFKSEHSDLTIQVVDNPGRAIPSGLNIAIANSNGQYLIRMDAHSIPYPDYIEQCLFDLRKGLGDNVGGIWEILPGGNGWIARAIAEAASHPLGVGDASYRISNKAGVVDTVPFGAFSRKLYEEIGPFDETLLTNEDYEFNTRITKSGKKVWLDPAIRSVYYARATLRQLAKQYWRYGYWKQQMLKRYPTTARWRQILPPLFSLSLLVLTFLAIFVNLARLALGLEILIYILILEIASFYISIKKNDAILPLGIPAAIAVMHVSWGLGFCWSFVHDVFNAGQKK